MVLNPACTLESPAEFFVVPLAKPLIESIKSESWVGPRHRYLKLPKQCWAKIERSYCMQEVILGLAPDS